MNFKRPQNRGWKTSTEKRFLKSYSPLISSSQNWGSIAPTAMNPPSAVRQVVQKGAPPSNMFCPRGCSHNPISWVFHRKELRYAVPSTCEETDYNVNPGNATIQITTDSYLGFKKVCIKMFILEYRKIIPNYTTSLNISRK